MTKSRFSVAGRKQSMIKLARIEARQCLELAAYAEKVGRSLDAAGLRRAAREYAKRADRLERGQKA